MKHRFNNAWVNCSNLRIIIFDGDCSIKIYSMHNSGHTFFPEKNICCFPLFFFTIFFLSTTKNSSDDTNKFEVRGRCAPWKLMTYRVQFIHISLQSEIPLFCFFLLGGLIILFCYVYFQTARRFLYLIPE